MPTPRHGMTEEQIRSTRARYGAGPHLAADLVVFSVRFHGDAPEPVILLVERKHPPYAGYLACPGGFVDPQEDLEPAARRELAEETGLTELRRAYVEQLGAWGHPERDPRGRVVSAVFLALVGWADLPAPHAGDDAARAEFVPVRDGIPIAPDGTTRELAFDHDRVLSRAWARIGELAKTTSAPLVLMPEHFNGAKAAQTWALLSGERAGQDDLLPRMVERGWIEPVAGTSLWRARSTAVDAAPAWWRI